MKTAQADLTTGPLGKKIFRFSIPLIFSNLLQVLFNMADVAVVGRFAGSTALGAVGSTTIFVSLFTGFLIGLSGGVNVLVAHHFGADDQKNLSDTVHSAALTCAAAGLVLLGIGCGFAGGILRALNTKPELMDGAVLYLRIYCLGMPALAGYNFGNAVFSAVGDTRRPLYYLSIAGVINVVLNLFFVIVCNMDVAGVAVASIISQYFSAILVTAALLRSRESYCLRLSQLRFLTFHTGHPGDVHFALRVRGESMLNAGILPGDLVVVRQQQTCNQGEIVVAMIDDEATVKRFSRKNGHIWLLPENDDYEPIDGTYAQILGKVVAVVRQY